MSRSFSVVMPEHPYIAGKPAMGYASRTEAELYLPPWLGDYIVEVVY